MSGGTERASTTDTICGTVGRRALTAIPAAASVAALASLALIRHRLLRRGYGVLIAKIEVALRL